MLERGDKALVWLRDRLRKEGHCESRLDKGLPSRQGQQDTSPSRESQMRARSRI
jgi:hypothetical protein